ncbi:DNA-directed RNA polymerases I, II, and III subunit RPABC1 [Trichinella sp. T6]|nr:DNA-directed RNA polymerases I, II, and III subunit RPABC1 [Trichinella sp. T6]
MERDENVIYNFWRMRKTTMEMCYDRNYEVTQKDIDVSLKDFIEVFGDRPSEDRPSRSALSYIVKHKKNEKNRLYVCFVNKKKPGKEAVKCCFDFLEAHNLNRIVLVLQEEMTPAGKKLALEVSKKFKIETFFESELMQNITKHELVPQHIILSKHEKMKVLEKYKIKETALPKILLSDPISRYYGASRGQVFKIIRRLRFPTQQPPIFDDFPEFTNFAELREDKSCISYRLVV